MGTRVATIVGSSVRKPSVEKIVASGVGVRVVGSDVSGRVVGSAVGESVVGTDVGG